MPPPSSITLVLGETTDDCRGVLLDGEGTGSMRPLTWTELEHSAPEGIAVEAVLCQSSPLLSHRRGLLAILRRAYPNAPFFSFSSISAGTAEGAVQDLGLD